MKKGGMISLLGTSFGAEFGTSHDFVYKFAAFQEKKYILHVQKI